MSDAIKLLDMFAASSRQFDTNCAYAVACDGGARVGGKGSLQDMAHIIFALCETAINACGEDEVWAAKRFREAALALKIGEPTVDPTAALAGVH